MSYYTISSQIGLSAKTIRNRISKLQKSNIIYNFTVKLNLGLLDYNQFCFLVIKSDLGDGGDKVISALKKICDTIGRLDCLENITIFHVAIKNENEPKFDSFLKDYRSVIIKHENILYPEIVERLFKTDLKIMKCLFSDPRMENSNIAKSIDRSTRTVKGRLTKMTNN